MSLSRQQLFETWWKSMLLGLTLLVALSLRVWGIGFGLPYTYHVDEHYYISTALKLGTGVMNNPPYAPTGLSNILFGEYAGYFVLGKVLGMFASGQEFEAAFRSDPSVFYMLGRFTTALLGAATVLMLYILGKSVSKPTVGLIAAWLLAVSFLHVRDSHYAVPDIAMTSFVVLAVALAATGMRYRQRRYIYMAALAGGLATAMKWTGLPVVMVVWWASVWVDSEARKTVTRTLFNWTAAFTVLLFVLGLALGALQVLTNPSPYLDEAFGQYKAGQAGGFDIWQVDTLPGWLFYGKTLLYGIGPILLVLGTIGALRRLILSAKTGNRVGTLLLLFPIIYYLLMGSTRHYFARYALPLIPFIALFAAEAIAAAATWAGARRAKLGWGLATILVAVAIAQPLAQSIRHNALLTRQDTRTLAKQWIEAHIPAGTRIAVDWPTHGPPLSTPEKTMPYSGNVYDVSIAGGTGLSDHPIAWYREQGFDYLVSSSFIYDIPMVHQKRDAERRAFYASLDQDLELIEEFRPYTGDVEPPFIFDEIYGPAISLWHRERPGPTLKVYRIQ